MVRVLHAFSSTEVFAMRDGVLYRHLRGVFGSLLLVKVLMQLVLRRFNGRTTEIYSNVVGCLGHLRLSALQLIAGLNQTRLE